MRSWHDAGRLISLCRCRKQRLLRALADLTRAREDGQAADRQLAAQQVQLAELMDAHRVQTCGAMTRAALFAARRHLAVLLRQRQLLALERERLAAADDAFARQERDQRGQLQLAEKKRNKYRLWMQQQRRLAQRVAERIAADEIEERLPWSNR